MLPNHFISADEQAELQLFTESLERFCDAEIEPHYRTWEKAGRVPRDLLRKMGENGYLCADVPDTYGGPGASVPFSFAVVEVLSRRGYGHRTIHTGNSHDVIPPHVGARATVLAHPAGQLQDAEAAPFAVAGPEVGLHMWTARTLFRQTL